MVGDIAWRESTSTVANVFHNEGKIDIEYLKVNRYINLLNTIYELKTK